MLVRIAGQWRKLTAYQITLSVIGSHWFVQRHAKNYRGHAAGIRRRRAGRLGQGIICVTVGTLAWRCALPRDIFDLASLIDPLTEKLEITRVLARIVARER